MIEAHGIHPRYWPMQKRLWLNEPGVGECFRSCLASILGTDNDTTPMLGAARIEDIPEVNDPASWDDTQHWQAVKWLAEMGLTLLRIRPEALEVYPMGHTICIATGIQKSTGLNHAVIWYTKNKPPNYGHLMHDPNPSGEGIIQPEWFEFIVPQRPTSLGPWGERTLRAMRLHCGINPPGDKVATREEIQGEKP